MALLIVAVATQSATGAMAFPETVVIGASGGHFDDTSRFALPCKNGQLSAVLRLKNLEFADIWQASGDVMLYSATQWVQLGAVTKDQKPNRLYARWRTSTSSRTPVNQDPTAFGLQQDVTQGVRINISWTDKGKIGAVLNGKVLSPLQLPVPLTGIGFFVVGAEARFDQITTSCDLTS